MRWRPRVAPCSHAVARRMVASRTGIPVLMHWIEALQRCWHLGPSSASGSARARMAKIERAFRRTVRGGALWSGLIEQYTRLHGRM